MLNVGMAQMLHRHGDDWAEMKPVDAHSPDQRDPERQLLHGEQLYRCESCDEEVRYTPPPAGG